MNKLIIMKLAKKINKEDIIIFANNQGIDLTNYEVNIIYDYIKNDSDRLFNNPDEVFGEIKEKISNNAYLKILELYNKYKGFIS